MRRDQGFSLLELVAVLSIFALVALIGVQVIQASLRSSERLTAISEETKDISLGLALLRQDLNAALPRVFVPPDGGTEPALVTRPGSFSLSVGGLARLDPGATGFGRVTWRFERATSRVTRAVWTSLTPGGGRAEDIVILEGVEAFEIASFLVDGGWRQGFDADPRTPNLLPLGLKVTLSHSRAKDLETLVSLR